MNLFYLSSLKKVVGAWLQALYRKLGFILKTFNPKIWAPAAKSVFPCLPWLPNFFLVAQELRAMPITPEQQQQIKEGNIDENTIGALAGPEQTILNQCKELELQLQLQSNQLKLIENILLWMKLFFEGKRDFPIEQIKFEIQNLKNKIETDQSTSSPEVRSIQAQWMELFSNMPQGMQADENLSGRGEISPGLLTPRLALFFQDFHIAAQAMLKTIQMEDEALRDSTQKRLEELSALRSRWEALLASSSASDSPFSVYVDYTLDHLQQLYTLQTSQTDRIKVQEDLAVTLSVQLDIAERLYQSTASNSMGLSLRGKLQGLPIPASSAAKIKKQIEAHTQSIFESNEKRRSSAEKTSPFIKQHKVLEELEKLRVESRDKYSLCLNDLEGANERLTFAIRECETLVHDYCLWLQDSPPLDLKIIKKDFKELRTLYQEGFAHYHLSSSSLALILAALFYLVVLFFWKRIYLTYKDKVFELEQNIDSIHKDRFSITLFQMVFQAFLSSLLPMLFCAFSLAAYLAASESAIVPLLHAISTAFLRTALVSWLLNFMANASRPGALFQKHFKLQPQIFKELLRNWKLRSLLFQCAWFGFQCFSHEAIERHSPTLARTHFIFLCVSAALFSIQVFRAGTPIFVLEPKSRYQSTINGGLNLALFSTILYSGYMAWKGFFETAQVILGNLGKFVLVWLVLMMAYQLVVRLMLLQRRRMAFEINLQKRAELLAQSLKNHEEGEILESEDVEVELKRVELDLKKVSVQTLSLIRSLTQLAGLVGLLCICARIQPIFKILALPIPFFNEITTLTLLTTSFATYMFYLLYVNLPAMLDLFILPHLDMTESSRYTLKYLTKISTLTLSIFLLFKILKIDQQTLQIFGAFLSAGVGFGIRDLINSLTAGALILTTKSLNIGDTVKIGEASGIVTQITVLNVILVAPDKKEISIPNKNLLYETFERWPSDELVHRIVLKIVVPSKFPTEPVVAELRKCTLGIPGLSLAPDGVLIEEITQGHFHYQLRALASELQNQASIRTTLYDRVVAHLENIGISKELVVIKG